MTVETCAAVADLLKRTLPAVDQHAFDILDVGDRHLRLRLPFEPAHAARAPDGRGQIYSGPLALGTADTALYACLAHALGPQATPLFVSMTATFLRPLAADDLMVEAEILRLTGRLAFAEARLSSPDTPEPAARIVATYALRRPKEPSG